MAKRIQAKSMEIAINALMEQYVSDNAEDMKDEARKIAKETVKQLKQTSPVGNGTGEHYKDGWTSKVESENSVSIDIRVHNRKKPWLTHLLEKGHAKRNGGRVPGIPHIAPAEKYAVEEYEKRLKARLSK